MSCNCKAKNDFISVAKKDGKSIKKFNKKGTQFYFDLIASSLKNVFFRLLSIILFVTIMPIMIIYVVVCMAFNKQARVNIPAKWFLKKNQVDDAKNIIEPILEVDGN